MNEEKNTPTNQELPEETHLTKEEILERSRTENEKSGDERERKLMNYGIIVMLCVGVILIFIVYSINLFFLNRASYELLAISFIMGGISFIWQGIVRRKMKVAYLTLGILDVAVWGVVFLYWCLNSAGVF